MTNKKGASNSGRRLARAGLRQSVWLWVLAGVGVTGVALGGWWLVNSSSGGARREISLAEAHARYVAGADFFLDVRTAEEWNQAHLPESTLIPLAELPNRLAELPRDRPIVVVCRSGRRSLEAQGILQQAGFKNALSMQGGLAAWQAAGYPTVTGP